MLVYIILKYIKGIVEFGTEGATQNNFFGQIIEMVETDKCLESALLIFNGFLKTIKEFCLVICNFVFLSSMLSYKLLVCNVMVYGLCVLRGEQRGC